MISAKVFPSDSPGRIVTRVRRLLPMISFTMRRPPPTCGRQALADDVAHRLRQPLPQHRLFLASKHAEDAADGLPALIVCRVEKTTCPVSDAVIAISIVSRSRISPTRITFGACRRAVRHPLANEKKSFPTSPD